MLDNPNTEVAEHDGSIASATDAIANLVDENGIISDGDASQPADNRDESGRFKKAEADADEADAKDADADAVDVADDDQGDEDDDEYLEIPSDEEGKEPSRLKVSEVYEGYQRSKELTTQLEQAKSQQIPPEQFDQTLQALVQERGNYIQALQQYQQFTPVQQPSMDLLNENSEHYNPPLYSRLKAEADHATAKHQQINQELEQQRQQQTQQEAALHDVMRSRELAKLQEFWPEMKTPEVQEQVRTDLQKHYGVDAALLDSIVDSRFFALAKDALAHRAQATEAKKAVKAVRAKPKLIPAKARSSSKNQRNTEAANRLAKSGSVDDAALAIEALM